MSKNKSESLDALEQYNKEQTQKRKKALLGAGSIMLVVTLGVGATWAVQSNSGKGDDDMGTSLSSLGDSYQKNSDQKRAQSSSPDAQEGGYSQDSEATQSEQKEVTLPTSGLPDFLQTSYRNTDRAFMREQLVNMYAGDPLFEGVDKLPSEAQGYTFGGGGGDDPYSVMVTREEFISSVGEYIQRILNPIYGGWNRWQFGGSEPDQTFDYSYFEDMFSQEYWDKNRGKAPSEFMPIAADWGNDNYGRDDLSPITRWYGEIVSSNSSFGGTVTEPQMSVSAKVKFRSLTKSGEMEAKYGTLHLVFRAATHGGRRPVEIAQADLVIDN